MVHGKDDAGDLDLNPTDVGGGRPGDKPGDKPTDEEVIAEQREEIDRLEGVIGDMALEIAELKSGNEALQESNAALSLNSNSLNEQVVILETSNEALLKEVASLTDEVSEIDSLIVTKNKLAGILELASKFSGKV